MMRILKKEKYYETEVLTRKILEINKANQIVNLVLLKISPQ